MGHFHWHHNKILLIAIKFLYLEVIIKVFLLFLDVFVGYIRFKVCDLWVLEHDFWAFTLLFSIIVKLLIVIFLTKIFSWKSSMINYSISMWHLYRTSFKDLREVDIISNYPFIHISRAYSLEERYSINHYGRK